jgi:hypothetical protein
VADNVASTASASQSLGTRNCTDLSYRIKFPVRSLNAKGLAEAIHAKVDYQGWYTATRYPQNKDTADYHIHIAWRTDEDDDETRLQVDYHIGPEQIKASQSEPFAERFMEWLGQFVSSGSVSAHIHAEFEYPLEKWQSKLFNLPFKVPYGAGKFAEIDGLELRLPSHPEGVLSIWLQLLFKRGMLGVQLAADRDLTFKGFSPEADVDALASVATSVITEKQS